MRADFTPWYDIMLVCEQGHMITDKLKKRPEDAKPHCSGCGAKSISKCTSCNTDIRGYKHVPRISYIGSMNPPSNCHNCGAGYPWRDLFTKKDTTNDPINHITQIVVNFFKIARSSRNRYSNRSTLEINDEYDVQDLFRSLLNLYFSDIRPEEWTPSYAGGSNRMDFLLKNEQIVIEIKKTRLSLRDKEIGEQLIIDIAKYKQHPDCKKLIHFIYDPEGLIGNPVSLINDLEKLSSTELPIKVFINPIH